MTSKAHIIYVYCPPSLTFSPLKTRSQRDQQAVKMSLQHQIDRSRATAEVYDQAYSRDVEVIKSIEESLISVFNKVHDSPSRVWVSVLFWPGFSM